MISFFELKDHTPLMAALVGEVRFLLRDEGPFRVEPAYGMGPDKAVLRLVTERGSGEIKVDMVGFRASSDMVGFLRKLADQLVAAYRESARSAPEPEPWQAAKVGNFIEAYSAFTRTTACNPGALTPQLDNLSYLMMGLASEAGEVLGKYKKVIRGDNPPPTREEVLAELGDVFWYACRLAEDLGSSPADVMAGNWKKLASRKKAGTIKGSGDNR